MTRTWSRARRGARRLPPCGAAALVLLACGEALPHDFWIQPASHAPRAGATLDLRLFVGDDLAGEEFPRSARHAERFQVLGPSGTQDVAGADQQMPAGRVELVAPGLHWVVYRSRDSVGQVEPAKFGPYLEEEGNQRWIADWRRRDPRGAQDVPEAFSRCAKALLDVGPAVGTVAPRPGPSAPRFDTRVGLTLELVPETHPRCWRPGRAFPVRLWLDGRPYADQQITARAAADPKRAHRVRTDACGRARFCLPFGGRWQFNSVHFAAASPGEEVWYRSTWSSLMLELPGAPGA